MELSEGAPALPELPSVELIVRKRRAEHRAAVEAEARTDPRIRNLLSAFNGELTRIRPLREP
jgi:hypothetical protein